MIETKGVVHFSIAVSDLDASRAFYTEVLGLKLVSNAPGFGMVFLRAGEDHVILCKSETPIQPNAEGSRRVHHAFKVESPEYDRAKGFLKSKGIAIIDEEDRAKGVFVGRQFYIHDPDRNVIELSEWNGTSKLD